MAELLLELLSEEIPARMQAEAAEDLKRLVRDGLGQAQLGFDHARAFVTPRRLVLVVDGLPTAQPDAIEERRGPRVGAPEQAIEGFLKSAGVSRERLEERDTPKGAFLFAVVPRKGRATNDVLAELIPSMLRGFPWPKSMRWRDTDARWVRPLHNILALFGGRVIDLRYDLALHREGATSSATAVLVANNKSIGHRFLAPERLEIHDFADYTTQLTAAKVRIDPAERRAVIAAQAERLAAAEGLTVRPDPALVDEVVGLVEWPVVMIGRIDEAFMAVPPEVLITSMRRHQKYFSLLDAAGKLAPRFIVVANTETRDGGRQIVAGNERVLRARLSDATFFWNQDRKQTLESRLPKLAERVFHAKLGSDLDRVERIAALAREVASRVGADPERAERAARLSKADLTTEMVGEFPELQGVMGRYYARHDGEPTDVADAIAEHYSPQGPSDRCPTAPVSVAVALADKLDTLVGFFRIGERPTGSKDPFALRRAALGVLRIVVENELRIPLWDAIERANARYEGLMAQDHRQRLHDELLDFFADRLKVHLREQGVRHDLISAVFAVGGEDDLVRLLARVSALKNFLATEDGANLLTAYRRASNIVRIEENKDGVSYQGEAEPTLLTESQETELHHRLVEARERIADALVGERFGEAMAVLASLRRPVDTFFDGVTVNCRDAQRRVNRLKLLSQIRSAIGGVADFSHIEG